MRGEKLGYSLNKNGRHVNTSILWNQIYQQDNPCDFRPSLPHYYHYHWAFRQRTAFNCTFREINIINEWGGGICVLGTSLVSLSKLLRLLTNIVIFRSVVWWGPSLQSETRTKTSEVGKFSQTHPSLTGFMTLWSQFLSLPLIFYWPLLLVTHYIYRTNFKQKTGIYLLWITLCFPDIDECSLQTHTCWNDSVCVNLPGGYDCVCTSGPGCSGDCPQEEGMRRNGEDWKPSFDRCAVCSCKV